eukprot:TRINITY_DN594_c0_g1_i1.p1 TRINITY_DN594_c0_g1~~TRINITY_DN594_c0_g1_i1.p1  ORF type:complete len:1764 (+),score=529.63 TRINITY_DN594_c0_g1_i1:98-5293(+)
MRSAAASLGLAALCGAQMMPTGGNTRPGQGSGCMKCGDQCKIQTAAGTTERGFCQMDLTCTPKQGGCTGTGMSPSAVPMNGMKPGMAGPSMMPAMMPAGGGMRPGGGGTRMAYPTSVPMNMAGGGTRQWSPSAVPAAGGRVPGGGTRPAYPTSVPMTMGGGGWARPSMVPAAGGRPPRPGGGVSPSSVPMFMGGGGWTRPSMVPAAGGRPGGGGFPVHPSSVPMSMGGGGWTRPSMVPAAGGRPGGGMFPTRPTSVPMMGGGFRPGGGGWMGPSMVPAAGGRPVRPGGGVPTSVPESMGGGGRFPGGGGFGISPSAVPAALRPGGRPGGGMFPVNPSAVPMTMGGGKRPGGWVRPSAVPAAGGGPFRPGGSPGMRPTSVPNMMGGGGRPVMPGVPTSVPMMGGGSGGWPWQPDECEQASSAECASKPRCRLMCDAPGAPCQKKSMVQGTCQCEMLPLPACNMTKKCAVSSLGGMQMCVSRAHLDKFVCMSDGLQRKASCETKKDKGCKWSGWDCVSQDAAGTTQKAVETGSMVLGGIGGAMDSLDATLDDALDEKLDEDVRKSVREFIAGQQDADDEVKECIEEIEAELGAPTGMGGAVEVQLVIDCSAGNAVTAKVKEQVDKWSIRGKKDFASTKEFLKDKKVIAQDALDDFGAMVEDEAASAAVTARQKAKDMRAKLEQARAKAAAAAGDATGSAKDAAAKAAAAAEKALRQTKDDVDGCLGEIKRMLGEVCSLDMIKKAIRNTDVTICDVCGEKIQGLLDQEERNKREQRDSGSAGLSWMEKKCTAGTFKTLYTAGRVLCAEEEGSRVMADLKDVVRPALEAMKAGGNADDKKDKIRKACEKVPAVAGTLLQKRNSFEARGVPDAISEKEGTEMRKMQAMCLRKPADGPGAEPELCGVDSDFVKNVVEQGTTWNPDADADKACSDPCHLAYSMVYKGQEGATETMTRCAKSEDGKTPCRDKLKNLGKELKLLQDTCDPISVLLQGTCSEECKKAYESVKAAGCCASPIFDAPLRSGIATDEDTETVLDWCLGEKQLPDSCQKKAFENEAEFEKDTVSITINADLSTFIDMDEEARLAIVADLIEASGDIESFDADEVETDFIGFGAVQFTVSVFKKKGKKSDPAAAVRRMQEQGQLTLRNLKELIETKNGGDKPLEAVPTPPALPWAKRKGGKDAAGAKAQKDKVESTVKSIREKLGADKLQNLLKKDKPAKDDLKKVRESGEDIGKALEDLVDADASWADVSLYTTLSEMSFDDEEVKEELKEMGAASDGTLPDWTDLMDTFDAIGDKVRQDPSADPGKLTDKMIAAARVLREKKIKTKKVKRDLGEWAQRDLDPAARQNPTREALVQLAGVRIGDSDSDGTALEKSPLLRNMTRDAASFFNQPPTGPKGLCDAEQDVRRVAMRAAVAMGNSPEARSEDVARFRAMCAPAPGGKTCGELFDEAEELLQEGGKCHFSDFSWSGETLDVLESCKPALKKYAEKLGVCLHEEIDAYCRGVFGEARQKMEKAVKDAIESVGAKVPTPELPPMNHTHEITLPGVDCADKSISETLDAVTDDLKDALGLADQHFGIPKCKPAGTARRGARALAGGAVVEVPASDSTQVAKDYPWGNTKTVTGTSVAPTATVGPSGSAPSGSSGSTSGGSTPSGSTSGGSTPAKDDDEGSSAGLILGIVGAVIGAMAFAGVAVVMVKRRSAGNARPSFAEMQDIVDGADPGADSGHGRVVAHKL